MERQAVRAGLLLGLALWSVCGLGCGGRLTRPYQEPPPPGLDPTVIDYADTDAFDALLETALTNQDPAILIRTEYAKPEWEGRLNGWIAAWNAGASAGRRRVRLQAPLPNVTVDADSIRELRLLIDSLMGRVDELAKSGVAWWAEEKVKARRIALLKPYNLRFNLDDAGLIQVILFNGRYADYHREFVSRVAPAEVEDGDDWARVVRCSRCRSRQN
jgi:hypothetical protein